MTHDDATFVLSATEPAENLALVVLGEGAARTHPLLPNRCVSIGRDEGSDVHIPSAAVGRKHAILRTAQGVEPIEIEDLGSANGTRIGGVRIERGGRGVLRMGQLLEIGDTALYLQRGLAKARAPRVWSYGYFEARLLDACERNSPHTRLAPFGVMQLRFDELAIPEHDLKAILVEPLRGDDLIARLARDRFVYLFFGRTAADLESLATRMNSAISARGAAPAVGLAVAPRDGTTPDALLAAARPALGAASAEPGAIEIVIEDSKMRAIHRLIEDHFAESMITVLLLGETGVGKEVCARALHRRSRRSSSPFVAVNIAALAPGLIESELFGHEAGAFSGAIRRHIGVFEQVKGGTLLLDEIGDLAQDLQIKLLRVIQERKIRRVGGDGELPVDIRLACSTRVDLAARVAAGKFREDLYHRINAATIVVPPLRERRAEIPSMALAFTWKFWSRDGREGDPEISPEALTCLDSYDWPGNVRELENCMEYAVCMTRGTPRIGAAELPEKVRAALRREPLPWEEPEPDARWSRDELEQRERVRAALEQANGNLTRAAILLGRPRKTVERQVRKFMIKSKFV